MPEPPPHLTDLPDAVYLPLGEGRFESTAWATGPWSPDSQHAGPVAALLAHCMERHDLGDTDPADVLLARCTVDLVRPAPVAPLDVHVRTVRAGRRAHWLEAVLQADGREVARATGLRLRSAPFPLPATAETPDPPLAGPDAAEPLPPDEVWPHLLFWHAVDVHPLTPPEPGPGTVWFRLRVPILAGTETTPTMRAMAASDFTLGISSPLGFEAYTYPNADLTVHLHRPPRGEWVCLDAVSRLDGRGTGTAEASLHDEEGRVGAALQSLVVAPR